MDPLNQYESSDDDDHSNTSDFENKPPGGRGDARPWKYDCPFETPEEARKFVESEGNWSIIDTNKTIGGKIKYYRCNRVKRRGHQCDAALYLHYPSSSLQVHLYRTDCAHTCHQIVQSSQRITETMRSEIDRMLVLKQKPKTIYEHLYDQGFRPTMKQIYNYSSAWRKKRFGPSSISLGELEEWCLSHQENHESVDDSYVIAHEIEYGDEDYEQQQSKKRKKNNEASFKVIISTKRLLQHIEGIDHVHCDATYKLTWEGMPVLIVGTTCMDKTFHPICIAVCSNEQKSSFSFIFRSLKEKAGLNAKFLVSDASDAIREAFIQVFGSSSKLAMCWAHAERCMEKKLHLVSEENKEEIWHDVQSLQICPDNSTFNKAKTLFIKKWTKKGENAFVEYMQLQWLTTHDGWHEGVGDEICLPSTNNEQ